MDPNQKVKDAFRTEESRAQFFLNDFNAEPSTTIDLSIVDTVTIFQELVIPYLLEKDISLLVKILNRNPLLFRGSNVWRGKSYAKLVNECWENLNEKSKTIIFNTFSHTDKNDTVGWTLLNWTIDTRRDLFHSKEFFSPEPSNVCSPIFHRYPKQITDTEKYQGFIKMIAPAKGISVSSDVLYFRLFMEAFLRYDYSALTSEMVNSLGTTIGWDRYPVRSSSSEIFAWFFESLHKNYIKHDFEYSVKTKYLLAFNEILDTAKREEVLRRIISSKPVLRRDPEKIYSEMWYIQASCFSPELVEELSQKDEDLKKQYYRHFYVSGLPMVPTLFDYAIEQRSPSAMTFSISPHLPECVNLKAEYDWYEEYYTQHERDDFISRVNSYLCRFYEVNVEASSLEQLISILESNIEEQYPSTSQKVS